MPLASATRVGPYEIVSTLGSGAMGEVYIAWDSRLSRNVALKMLPSGMPTDATRRRRFIQEARSASALNHPNIVTIHDFGTIDGTSYIVSELVDGESLRAVIQQGAMPMRKLLDLAVQMADGLSAAHAAGIVHRDLKPENIMLAANGRVKILDFGLAKPILPGESDEGQSASSTFDGGTEPGLILGTIGYMSPEQARGAPVSFQSDQFSLGVILHEMATGQQAFRRETPMQTLLAIANVDRLPFTPGPVAFRLLVQKCLAKDPAERFASTVEIHDRLRKIRQELPEGAAPVAPKRPRLRVPIPKPSKAVWWAMGACALLFAAGLWIGRVLDPNYGVDLSKYEFTPVSSAAALDAFPAIAPSGKQVAYSEFAGGHFQIFTRTIGSALPAQLTTAAEDCLFPFWSSDSARVFYISGGALWGVSSLGGTPELLFENVTQAAQSPDGKMLALIRDDSLWVSGKKFERPPFPRSFRGPSFLRFSPDGKKLAVWISKGNGASELWMIPWPDGAPKQAAQAPIQFQARMFTWMPDSRRIVFSDQSHLWIADTRNGKAHKITADAGREQWPSLASDGRVLAFSAVDTGYNLMEIPFDKGARETVTALSGQSGSLAPNRPEYAYVTDRNEVILHDELSGWDRVVVSSKDFPDATSSISGVSFSPDGQRIAYSRSSNGMEAIWISRLTGETAVRIAEEPGGGFQRAPTWSPDGNWIAYFSARSGQYVTMKAQVGGSAPPMVVKPDGGTNPTWSPNGDWIATLDPKGGLILVSPDGAKTQHLGDGAWMCAAWAKGGGLIYGIREEPDLKAALTSIDPLTNQQQAIRELTIDPAAISYGSSLGQAPMRGSSVSPDGKTLLTSVLRVKSHVWLLQGFTQSN